MEPDIFDVQAPGLSCQLVYDQSNSVFRTIPYQDLQVSYALNVAQNSIISFTITNDKGTVYTFNVPESVTQTTSSTAPGNIFYFKRQYNLYQNGIIFNQKWYLSKIQDIAGNYISLSYNIFPTARNLSGPTHVMYGIASGFAKDSVLYNTSQVYSPQFIFTISSVNKLTGQPIDQVAFNYSATTDVAGYLVSSINLNSGHRLLACTYNKVPGKTRDFLTYFGESGCSAGGSLNFNQNLYAFAYSGVNFTGTPPSIPDFSLNGATQDFWGYIDESVDFAPRAIYVFPDNPSFPNLERYRLFPIAGYTGTSYSLNGENASVDPSVTMGTLNQITYPTGGNTSLTFESNDFYDVSAAATFQGGGVRIKQIADYDGISSANNIIRNYTYLDPVTTVTSGKPISLPAIGFTIPYTGTATGLDYWNYSTVRLPPGCSNQDESIIYGKVTVQQTGAGKQLFEFTTPGTYWDASASPDWTPTMVYAGRLMSGGSCPSIGSLKNAKYAYPFIPNVNYDFERGLLTKATTYNEAGNIVAQSTNTYQRSYATPVKITSLKFDNNSTAEGYAKYQIYSSTSELLSTETKFLNDLANTTNDPARQIASTTNFYYSGVNHKLPTKIEKVNTDGSTDRTYVQYTKDYTYMSDDVYDQPMGSIKALAGLNVNIPIEKQFTVTRSGIEKTVKAELIKYGSFSSGLASPSLIYLPTQSLNFISSAGLTSFPISFNSGGNFVSYSGYFPVVNYSGYNASGALLSKDDNYKNTISAIIDDNNLLPIATILNAKYNEISYSNFDGSEPKYGLSVSNATYNSSVSRTGAKCLTLPTTGSLLDTLNLKVNAKNYIYSCWINSSAAGVLTVSVYTSSGTLFGTQTVNFAANGSGWTYYEQKISTNGLTASFSFKVQTNTSINIDDILFYPENTEVSTSAYDVSTFLKTAETNTNGVSKYYAYDPFYRLQYVYDQDKNIVLKKTYATANTIALISASFTTSPSSGISAGQTVSFTGLTNTGICTPGNYYSYNFGDGSSSTPSLVSANATHSYATAGPYTVTFTITNSAFGTKTATQAITVLMNPQFCQSGVWAYVAPTTYIEACSPNPNDMTHSYFTINSITGLPTGHTVSYQWQIAYTATGTNCGSTSWTTTGTNTSQFVKAFSASTFCPYKIQCIITDVTSGQVVTVQVGSVANNIN